MGIVKAWPLNRDNFSQRILSLAATFHLSKLTARWSSNKVQTLNCVLYRVRLMVRLPTDLNLCTPFCSHACMYRLIHT